MEAILGGRFVLSGSVDDIRQQFAALWENLASKLPPPSDAVTTRMYLKPPETWQRKSTHKCYVQIFDAE